MSGPKVESNFMQLSGAQILARFLKEAGVRHIFGVSGHSVFDITDAVYLEPGIEFVPATIELCASFMANSYGSVTRHLGVCLGSSGAGVTNLVTGIAEAYKESMPVIALGADVPRRVAGKGASSWHEVPQAELLHPITKLSRTIRRGHDVLETLCEAYCAATMGRRGPVYVGLPTDVQREEVEVPPPPWVPAPKNPPPADPGLIQYAARELAQAQAPTILVGGGAYWADAAAEVRELAELLHAPVGTSHSQKGFIPDDDALALGNVGFGAYPFSAQACQESDLILAVGTTFSEGMTLGFGHRIIPERAKIVQIDLDPGEIGKNYPVHVGIVGDAKEVSRAILARLKSDGCTALPPSPRLERIAREKAAWREDVGRRGSRTDGPITHWHICEALRKVIRNDAAIVAAGCTGEIHPRLVATAPVYQSGDFRVIGHGLSSAIGIKYALPEQQVVTITGDGSFMMELEELATAARANIPLLLIVVHNSAYGNMKRDQVRHYGGRVTGTDLLIPDLPMLAASFGVYGAKVERPAELEPAMRQALAVNGPALLDVICPIEGL